MEQEDIVYDLLMVSGIKKSKARKLARVIAAVYTRQQRPDEQKVTEILDRAADFVFLSLYTPPLEEDGIADKRTGSASVQVRQRIKEILFNFYMGLATNGTYDALKYFFIYLSTLSGAEESDELGKEMAKAVDRWQQAFNSLPTETAEELRSEMDTIDLFRENYEERIKQELLNDELLVAFFNGPDSGLEMLAGEFERLFMPD